MIWRVIMDQIFPHIVLPIQIPHHLPQATVALKPSPKAYHKHSLPFLQPLLRLHVRQHVPNTARRRVPEPVQRHPRRLHVVLAQSEILPDRVNHRLPSGMETKMVHPTLEVDCRSLPCLAPSPHKQCHYEAALQEKKKYGIIDTTHQY